MPEGEGGSLPEPSLELLRASNEKIRVRPSFLTEKKNQTKKKTPKKLHNPRRIKAEKPTIQQKKDEKGDK